MHYIYFFSADPILNTINKLKNAINTCIFVHCIFSILAEEFLTSKEIYEQAAKDNTAENACQSMESIEKVNYFSFSYYQQT